MWTVWLTSGTRGGSVGNSYVLMIIQKLVFLFVSIVNENDVIHM